MSKVSEQRNKIETTNLLLADSEINNRHSSPPKACTVALLKEMGIG
jgi:hypothetical protein